MKQLKTEKDFTEEIKAKIPAYQSKCMDLSGTVESSTKYIEKIYELAGQKKPLIFYAENITEYKILFEVIPSILGNKNLRSSLRSSLDSSLNSSLDSSLNSSLDSSLNSSLDSSLESSLDSSLRSSLNSSLDSSLDSSLNSSLDSSLDSSLESSLRSSLYSSLESSLKTELNKTKQRSVWAWYCSIYSRVYLTWYKFIQDEFNIEHDLKDTLNELYELSMDSIISRCWLTETYVLVLKNPSKVNFINDQLHNSHGASYEYPNGEKYYNVIGREISKEVFGKITEKTYTPSEFFKTENEDEKAACIAMMQELYGDTHVFDFFREVMQEVDTYTDVKDKKYLEGTTNGMNIGVYTLFKGNVEDTEISYVRCYCPSTDRMFFLGVEPKYNNAKDAISSLFRVPIKLKNEIKYIQRQGERFSTVFTNNGKVIIKQMAKEDFQNTTTISGNEYFSKMQYEY